MRKKVNHRVWGWISINALLGIVLAMGLNYYGLRATNAAYSVNFLNLIPVVTFVVAVILRGEKLVMATWPGKMKVLGTVICVGGTMVISLYKGRLLHLWPSHLLKPQLQAVGATSSSQSHHHNMLAGTLFLCGSCLCTAAGQPDPRQSGADPVDAGSHEVEEASGQPDPRQSGADLATRARGRRRGHGRRRDPDLGGELRARSFGAARSGREARRRPDLERRCGQRSSEGSVGVDNEEVAGAVDGGGPAVGNRPGRPRE